MKGYCPKCNKEIDEVDYDIENKMCFDCSKKLCITCGKNEAINDFYKECRDCIEEYQLEKELREANS